MPLLSEVRAEAFTAGPPKRAATGMTVTPLFYDGDRGVLIQLDGEVTALYNPSSFDAASTRQTVPFRISEDTAKQLLGLESAIGAACGVDSIHSNIKQKDGVHSFKVKMTPPVTVMDANNISIAQPEEWRDLRMKVIVMPRCVYHQPTMKGIVWELTAVQILGPVPGKALMFR